MWKHIQNRKGNRLPDLSVMPLAPPMTDKESSSTIENLFDRDRSAPTCEKVRTSRLTLPDDGKLGTPKIVAYASLALPEK
jgi:hypothetical protein